MRTHVLPLAAVALAVWAVAESREQPRLPDDHTAYVEVNYLETNVTRFYKDVYSYSANVYYIESQELGFIYREAINFTSGNMTIWWNGHCMTLPVNQTHLARPNLMLVAGTTSNAPQVNATYAGHSVTRGISTDRWIISNVSSSVGTFTKEGYQSAVVGDATIDIEWFFTQYGWEHIPFSVEQSARAPVRYIVRGNWTNETMSIGDRVEDPTSDDGILYDFVHIFELSSPSPTADLRDAATLIDQCGNSSSIPTQWNKCGGVDCSNATEEFCNYPVGDCGRHGIFYGICLEKPVLCTGVIEPVCGCNNVTYENECKAHQAGVNILSVGACGSATPTGNDTALPTLPNAWSARIEVNVLNKNETMTVQEAYDYGKNRMRFDEYANHTTNPVYATIIYNFDEHLRYFIVQNESRCHVSRLLSGSRLTDADGHLRPSGSFLDFGPQLNETRIPSKRVRGILCDCWTSAERRPAGPRDLVMYLEWCFATPSWKMDINFEHAEHRIPVRLNLTGHWDYKNGTMDHSFTHYYEFFDFLAGSPRSDTFKPPADLVCQLPHDGPDLPHFPRNFSAILEVVNRVANITTHAYEAYDYDANLYKTFAYHGNQSVTTYYNFTAGIRYEVTTPASLGPMSAGPHALDGIENATCSNMTITPGADGLSADNGHILSPGDMFTFGQQYNETYKGETEMRGYKVDHWQNLAHGTRRVLSGRFANREYEFDVLLDWYFMSSQWAEFGRSSTLLRHLPVAVHAVGTITFSNPTEQYPIDTWYNYVDFEPGVPPSGTFAVPVSCVPAQPSTQEPAASSTTESGHSTGAVVGIFFVGVVVGASGYVVFKRTKNKRFKRRIFRSNRLDSVSAMEAPPHAEQQSQSQRTEVELRPEI